MVVQRPGTTGLDERLANSLTEGAFLSREDVERALSKSKNAKMRLAEVLLADQMITPETLTTVLSFILKVPVVELRQFRVQPEAVALVPENVARERNVLPLSTEGDVLRVAMEDPQDVELIDTLAALTRKRIRPVLPLRGGLKEAIDSNYKSTARVSEELNRMVRAAPVAVPSAPIRRLDPQAVAEAPVVKAVDSIVAQAVKDRASDIHFVPQEDSLKVFYRIDGVLHEAVTLPLGVQQPLLSRLKVVAGMDIAERRRPQDGQFAATVEGKDISFRVATVETYYGEMMVLRVLDKSVSLLKPPELGFHSSALATFERLLALPFGMILVSGPTGSGKTTTLYGALNALIGQGDNIMTIEDPIEYQFAGINQIQVNRQAGITFAAGLRAIMRLDPDIILVGEIRDKETAEIAVQAALTGHLVLSTIHSNDAASSIVRLIDMGIEPFLVTSAVVGCVAQRLVRRVDSYCQTVTKVAADEALAYQQSTGEAKTDFYTGRGCNFCSYTGYRGRVGVFEVLALSDAIRAVVARNGTSVEIKELAIKEGMLTMRQDGMLKARDGITTPGEVIRNAMTIQ